MREERALTQGGARQAIDELGFGMWRPPGDLDEATGVWFVDEAVPNTFPDSGVEVFASVDDESFWFDHRNEMIVHALRRYGDDGTFLEVGSGSGVVAAALERSGRRVAAVEPIASGAIGAAARGVTASFCGDLASLQLPADAVGAIGAFDVVEHLEDPVSLLRECRRIMRPAGTLILTVPGHPFLWSDFDEWNGHFRRYTRRSLDGLVGEAGFEPLWTSHFFVPLVLPATLSRVIKGRIRGARSVEEIESTLSAELSPPHPIVDRLLRLVHRPERALIGRLGVPLGTSVMVVARPRP